MSACSEQQERHARSLLQIVRLGRVVRRTLSANRTVPEWQGWSRHPRGVTTKCAAGVFGQFGRVTRETGRRPEAGLIRLHLYDLTASHRSPPILNAYLDGDSKFSSIFMDASDRRKADAAWSKLRRPCGLSSGG